MSNTTKNTNEAVLKKENKKQNKTIHVIKTYFKGFWYIIEYLDR